MLGDVAPHAISQDVGPSFPLPANKILCGRPGYVDVMGYIAWKVSYTEI